MFDAPVLATSTGFGLVLAGPTYLLGVPYPFPGAFSFGRILAGTVVLLDLRLARCRRRLPVCRKENGGAVVLLHLVRARRGRSSFSVVSLARDRTLYAHKSNIHHDGSNFNEAVAHVSWPVSSCNVRDGPVPRPFAA
jgi:hypothetical protein